MLTPTYVAKKMGDRYILVPKNPLSTPGRLGWMVGGAVGVAAGVARRGPGGVLLTAVGAAMVFRGMTGRNPLHLLFESSGGPNGNGHDSPSFRDDEHPSDQLPEDAVDEAAMESFPASDAPARSRAASS